MTNIAEVFKYCNFQEWLGEDNYRKNIVENMRVPADNLAYAHGATRCVVFQRDANFVYKIPFDVEWGYDDVPSFIDTDYCRREIAIYHQAKKRGIAYLFSAERFAGKVQDHPIYIQARAVPLINRPSAPRSQEQLDLGQILKTLGYSANQLRWKYDVVHHYGLKNLIRLLKFIDEMKINDLHNANLGYSYTTGKPVIFDYAGYGYDD